MTGNERTSPETDVLAGLAERLDRLFLAAEDGKRFVLATESANNIVEIVREWIRSRSHAQTPAVLEDWSCVADFLDDIQVDDNGTCRWADVANAQAHIRRTMRAMQHTTAVTSTDRTSK